MTYIIVEPCVGLKDSACVDVCPVDCIYTRDQDDMYYISPDECIDCDMTKYIAINYDYFKNVDPSEMKRK